jgi:hypothetical protein
MEIKEGIVGFFDILGYQEIIANDEIEQTSAFVSDLFEKLPGEVEKTIKSIIAPEYKVENKIEWNMFSDTILLNMPVVGIDFSFGPWQLFVITSICLLRQMFEKGVPVRGGIAYGKYFIADKCIAGKPIVDAHAIGQLQNWTGCCFDKTAENEYDKFTRLYPAPEWKKIANQFVFKYIVPLKDSSNKLYTINWVNLFKALPPVFPDTNYRQTVLKSFSKNNKQLKPDVINKVNNTELFISYVKANKLEDI